VTKVSGTGNERVENEWEDRLTQPNTLRSSNTRRVPVSKTRSGTRPAIWDASPFTMTTLSCKTLRISPARSKISSGSTSMMLGIAMSSFWTSCVVTGRPPDPPPSSSSSSTTSRNSRSLAGLSSSITEEPLESESESEVSESEFSGDESGLTKEPRQFSEPVIQGVSAACSHCHGISTLIFIQQPCFNFFLTISPLVDFLLRWYTCLQHINIPCFV